MNNQRDNTKGEFGLGIRFFQEPDGTEHADLRSINRGVPTEFVMMQLKAFVKQLENKYYDNLV